jgi:hypothetical protein
MHTVKLRVNDLVYEKLIQLLNKFDKNEVEIINETSDFKRDQKYLAAELNEIIKGNADFIQFEEVEKRLENVILKNENNN